MAIDDQTALYIHDLVEHTVRRRCVTREEAKQMVLDAARVVCAAPLVPVKPVLPPVVKVLMPYGGTA